MSSRQRIEETSLVGEPKSLIYDVLSDLERERKAARALTWESVRAVAARISDHGLGTIRTKYNPSLYLQREVVKRTFDDFLNSDKIAFVLLGKSGVGKTCHPLYAFWFLSSEGTALRSRNGSIRPGQFRLSQWRHTILSFMAGYLMKRIMVPGSETWE